MLFLAYQGRVLSGDLEGPFHDVWRTTGCQQSLGTISPRNVFDTREVAEHRAAEQRVEHHARKQQAYARQRRGHGRRDMDRYLGEDFNPEGRVPFDAAIDC